MFALLGIAWIMVTTLCLWLFWQCIRLIFWAQKAGSVTIQVMTSEERRQQEEFVEHARRRAWKELYMEVGNG